MTGNDDADKKRDQVLKRMLQTPPKPHKPAKGEESEKAADRKGEEKSRSE